MDGDAEDPGWGRSTWARWCLDHDDAQAAALELEAGDEIDVVSEEEFPALARALHRQGLAAIYEDGHVHVHSQEEAQQILAEIEAENLAASKRRPPARAPASPIGELAPATSSRSRQPPVASPVTNGTGQLRRRHR
jgi:hypothetical protein